MLFLIKKNSVIILMYFNNVLMQITTHVQHKQNKINKQDK